MDRFYAYHILCVPVFVIPYYPHYEFNILLAFTTFSLGVNADLKKAIAYDQAGEYERSAKELYKISLLANRGHPRAMYEFGTMHMKEGMWVVQSEEAAIDWWLKSANLGYAPAQFSIGASYIGGVGVNKDLNQEDHNRLLHP